MAVFSLDLENLGFALTSGALGNLTSHILNDLIPSPLYYACGSHRFRSLLKPARRNWLP
jgi:hypothetical protein